MIRRTVSYSGNVQGVGFRFRVHHIATAYLVTGFVMNLDDGKVELVVEGDSQEIDRFLTDVSVALQGNIRHVRQDTTAASGEFSGFEIRR